MASIEETEIFVQSASAEGVSRVHWRSVLAGLLVSLIVYMILMSLGLAIGAQSFQSVMNGDESAKTVGVALGTWAFLSVLISLFVGSYSASRANNLIATRIGLIQGAVITSVFFLLMISQIGMTLASFSRGFSELGGLLIGQTANVAQSSQVSGLVEDSLTSLNLKAPIKDVATGLSTRLIRGDMNSARDYLASQAGISPDDARARLQTLNANVQNALHVAGEKTALAAKDAGWAGFATMAVGLLAAVFGGALGAQVSLRKPVDAVDRRALRRNPRLAFNS